MPHVPAITRVTAAVGLVLLAVAGCGGDGDVAAPTTVDAEVEPPDCDALTGVLADGTDTIRALVADPTGASEDLEDLADELRAAGDEIGGAVASPASELADLYDAIASGMQSGDMPDVAEVTTRTTALAEACGA